MRSFLKNRNPFFCFHSKIFSTLCSFETAVVDVFSKHPLHAAADDRSCNQLPPPTIMQPHNHRNSPFFLPCYACHIWVGGSQCGFRVNAMTPTHKKDTLKSPVSIENFTHTKPLPPTSGLTGDPLELLESNPKKS